ALDVAEVYFLFPDPPTTALYTLSLHDALPIWASSVPSPGPAPAILSAHEHALDPSSVSAAPESVSPGPKKETARVPVMPEPPVIDRKSTRLNSSHLGISYAVFCLKKKRNTFL